MLRPVGLRPGRLQVLLLLLLQRSPLASLDSSILRIGCPLNWCPAPKQ